MTPPSFCLRPQEGTDDAFLRRLFAAGLDASLGLHLWPEPQRELMLRWQYEARERDWNERYPPGSLEVIEVDGVPAGRIRLSRPDLDDCRQVVDLAVAPEYRRRGVATAALARCPGPLALRVARDNLPARRLYDRLGFTLRDADALHLSLRGPTNTGGSTRSPRTPSGS